MLQNIPPINSLLRICAIAPGYADYALHWGVVMASYEAGIELRIYGREIALCDPLSICCYIEGDSKNAIAILDRLDAIANRTDIDNSVRNILYQIATDRPMLSYWQDKLLTAIERSRKR